MSRVKRLLKKAIPRAAFRAAEPQYHRLEAAAAAAYRGFPARGLHVIGVTGTNGKTTTSSMIHRMLVDADYPTALMTTVSSGVGNDIVASQVHMTTAGAPLLQKRIAEFRQQGAEWLVLETTSHALAQYRVWGIPYEIGVMTNITHEHLDYHGSFERYLAAKLRLFRIAAKHGRKFGIYNADDPSAARWRAAVPRSLGYGLHQGELVPHHVHMTAQDSAYQVSYKGVTYDIVCNIPGEFNVYNSLAAVAVGIELGLSKQQIEQGIAALKSVDGRMNTIDEGQPYAAVIDFAHTPDSFEKLLSDLRHNTVGKLVVLFGSAGRRDESKRAIQGEIAGRYADEVVLTEEDDRDVDGETILEQIAEGARRSGKVEFETMFKLLDRSEAIQFAVSRVKTADDTVVFLGKGHEKVIERADGEHPWDEAAEVRTAIRASQAST
ncbi:UDP-N-acetylmuramoyl-L-alanyl-D-glutamate--2,6-diaminopimelate ligase [Candidatus Saccharibacteria bacterium]|nr:MAG: UDP-N-acetylmuramoyl-L-alanyl-D-glutamate--2,6-diaminopimelate ligase [Candidatus Saccharibacteria bacterium]